MSCLSGLSASPEVSGEPSSAKDDDTDQDFAAHCRSLPLGTEPVHGRIVLVGDVNLQLAYTPFYEKENELLFACDRSHEEFGLDYSTGHVRWTEGCIIETYLTAGQNAYGR